MDEFKKPEKQIFKSPEKRNAMRKMLSRNHLMSDNVRDKFIIKIIKGNE
jgi:hypothetical protein